ncbi:MAG: NAD-dependent epimerase/dehydratase family protein [Allosphingosinicella sp.]
MTEPGSETRPVVLITGAAGNLGRTIAAALSDAYQVVGLDRDAGDADFEVLEADLTSQDSLAAALDAFRARWGGRIASVVHLAAYFDFTGEEHPLYDTLNVEGTRLLLRALQRFEVEQFVYASTMLVHAPGEAGETIDENQPIGPRWAYPRSKAAAEQAVREEAGGIPRVILRLAGVYDEETMVPTLAHQIARIHQRDLQSHFYPGDTDTGQAMLHRDDMAEAFRRTIDRRDALPAEVAILIGEPSAPTYDELQDEIGRLIHGRDAWTTLRLPKPIAAAGAWAQDALEPLIPDALDKGEEPFVKPFMVLLADDHYDLDVSRARDLLGWAPERRLLDVLPDMAARLKRDPPGWYKANGLTPPGLPEEADAAGSGPAGRRDPR